MYRVDYGEGWENVRPDWYGIEEEDQTPEGFARFHFQNGAYRVEVDGEEMSEVELLPADPGRFDRKAKSEETCPECGWKHASPGCGF